MKDPDGVFERQGPNMRHPDRIRFTDNAQVASLEPVNRSYLKEAMGCAAAGVKPPKEKGTIDLPEELAQALDADRTPAEAFHALTSGRHRSHVIAQRSAKRPHTRMTRVAALRGRILARKGATER
ncbi:MAG TPA: YdeI/OmpD-associated family protein [Rubrivivax sp.]|nr:YdeI/OmpD-associated family protein [Rubrivivax sp.]